MQILGMSILHPVPFLVVIIIATLLDIGSIFIHRKLVDPKRSEEIKRKIEDHQKRYVEAQKIGDKKELERLEDEQDEIMKLVKESMYSSFKPMLITTPIVLVLLWILGDVYGGLGPIVSLPFGIPFITHPFKDMGIINGMDWLGLYITWAVIVSLILQVFTRRRKK